MNKNNLYQIFQGYVDKFDYFNDESHTEYYKWQICHEFPILMKKALESQEEDFSKAFLR